jgi:hypothetical protein
LEQARAKLRAGGRKARSLEDSVQALEAKAQDPPLHSELLVIPVKHVPLRIPKFDVRLKESALRAVPWAALPELHLEEPAQDSETSGASAWRVLLEPRPVTSGKARCYASVRRELLDSPCDGILAFLEQARAKLRAGGRKVKALEVSVQALEAKAQDPPLHSELLLIPVKHVPLRVPTFDVRLKETALRAEQAKLDDSHKEGGVPLQLVHRAVPGVPPCVRAARVAAHGIAEAL